MSHSTGNPEESANALRARLQLPDFLDRRTLDRAVLELGIRQVDARTHLHSGSVSATPEGWRIAISEFDQADRQLFTLAHELGHVVFGQENHVPVDATVEERWCNRFAAELLMPKDLVLARFSNATRPLLAAIELGRVAHVSMSSAFIQLRDVCGWKVGLICFRRSKSRWRVISTTGLPGSVMITVLPGVDLDRQLLAPIASPRSIGLSLSIAGQEVLLESEIYGRGQYRWAMVRPEKLKRVIRGVFGSGAVDSDTPGT